MSETKKQYHKENPEAAKEHGKKMKEYYENNPEARQKMSEITKKHFKDNPECLKKKLDTQGRNKPFDVFTTNGTLINTFNYKFEAREYLQKEHHITSTINISGVLRGICKSSAGFVFKYK